MLTKQVARIFADELKSSKRLSQSDDFKTLLKVITGGVRPKDRILEAITVTAREIADHNTHTPIDSEFKRTIVLAILEHMGESCVVYGHSHLIAPNKISSHLSSSYDSSSIYAYALDVINQKRTATPLIYEFIAFNHRLLSRDKLNYRPHNLTDLMISLALIHSTSVLDDNVANLEDCDKPLPSSDISDSVRGIKLSGFQFLSHLYFLTISSFLLFRRSNYFTLTCVVITACIVNALLTWPSDPENSSVNRLPENVSKFSLGNNHVVDSDELSTGDQSRRSNLTKDEKEIDKVKASLPIPVSGTLQTYIDNKQICPLTIKSSSSHSIVRLRKADSKIQVMDIFVRKNEWCTVKVPPGYYQVTFANGSNWQGFNDLFIGNDSSFSKANDNLVFTYNDSGYTSITLTLYDVVNGNLHTAQINREDF